MNIHFLLFLPLHKWTGGNLYQRQIIKYLRRAGHRVRLTTVTEIGSPAALIDPADDLLLWDGMSIIKWRAMGHELPAARPQALIVHAPFAGPFTGQEPWLPFSPAELHQVEQALFGQMDLILTPSAKIKDLLVNSFGVPGERVSVHRPTAYLPVNSIERRPAKVGSGGWQFISIGALSPRKNQLALIEALAGLRQVNWTLHLVGDPTANNGYTAALTAAAQKHKIEARLWMGNLATGRLLKLLETAHLHLFPSHDEGFGMAIFETIHAGVPTAFVEANCGLGPAFKSIIPVSPANDACGWRQVLDTFLATPQRYQAQAASRRQPPPAWAEVVSAIEQQLQQAASAVCEK